jgi:hypothetical protein
VRGRTLPRTLPRTHARTHAHTRMHACLHAHTHARTYARMHVHTYAQNAGTYARVRMHARTNARAHTRTHGQISLKCSGQRIGDRVIIIAGLMLMMYTHRNGRADTLEVRSPHPRALPAGVHIMQVNASALPSGPRWPRFSSRSSYESTPYVFDRGRPSLICTCMCTQRLGSPAKISLLLVIAGDVHDAR